MPGGGFQKRGRVASRAPYRSKKQRTGNAQNAMVPVYVAPKRKLGYRLGKLLRNDAYNIITRTTVIGDRGSDGNTGKFLGICANGSFATSVSSSTAATALGSQNINMQFSLGQTTLTTVSGATTVMAIPMPSFSDIVNMYDQFRIAYVELTFLFSANSFNSPNGVTAVSPQIWFAKDYDDAGTVTLAEVVQYNNVLCWCPAKSPKFVIRIKPKVQDLVYGTALNSGYAPGSNRWMSTANTVSQNAPHYGLKMVCDVPAPLGVGTDIIGYFTVCCKYFLEVKNMK